MVLARRGRRDAEVRDARGTVEADEHVLWGDVAVHHVQCEPVGATALVGGMETREQVTGDRRDDVDRQTTAALRRCAYERAEVDAVDPIHHERRLVAADEFDDANHVRVTDAQAELRLVLEGGERRRVLHEERVGLLQRDDTALAAFLTSREVDGGHAADAQRPHDLECARGVGHGVGRGRGPHEIRRLHEVHLRIAVVQSARQLTRHRRKRGFVDNCARDP